MFSFIRISFIYTHLWKEYQRLDLFITFVTNEMFKILYTEGKHIRYYFNNNYIIY